MANMSINTIAVKTSAKVISGNGFFSTFLNIPMPVLIIKNATALLIPVKAYLTNLFCINSSKNRETIKMIVKDGKTTPAVAAMLPKTPLFL